MKEEYPVVDVVYFAHGQESGPWGSKIRYLADRARARGLAVESPDYSHSMEGPPREAQLVELLQRDRRMPVLVGSSMGAWVSCRAAQRQACRGLFLMAPAFDMPDHPAAELPDGIPAWLVHGWQDGVVPPHQSLDRARTGHRRLLMVPDGHRLSESKPDLLAFFDAFLDHVGDA